MTDSRREQMNRRRKVMVSGCYDLLHAGHVAFFEEAASHGDLWVCIGSDENIHRLKHHDPMFGEKERLYLVQSLRVVHEARISRGRGLLDFEPELEEVRPDVFFVNEDGASEEKRKLCQRHGVEYVVSRRVPRPGLPARSSTALKASLADRSGEPAAPSGELPYRICLAGGWLDQPFVSSVYPGPVVVVGIEPTRSFNLRSGMATSTRNVWQRVRQFSLFPDDPIELARLLFGYENPPGTEYISGSQDHLGLVLPGASCLWYDGGYWPERIDSILEEETCAWLERSLSLVELFERPGGYDPLVERNITPEGVRRLSRAGELCWEGIVARDIERLGRGLSETHRAWGEILPRTTDERIEREMARYPSRGCVTSGCGGGYIVLASEDEVPGGFRVKVRRG